MSSDSTDSTFGAKNPRHFMVLNAIAMGIKDIDKISRTTKLPRQEVELIINDSLISTTNIKRRKEEMVLWREKTRYKNI